MPNFRSHPVDKEGRVSIPNEGDQKARHLSHTRYQECSNFLDSKANSNQQAIPLKCLLCVSLGPYSNHFPSLLLTYQSNRFGFERQLASTSRLSPAAEGRRGIEQESQRTTSQKAIILRPLPHQCLTLPSLGPQVLGPRFQQTHAYLILDTCGTAPGKLHVHLRHFLEAVGAGICHTLKPIATLEGDSLRRSSP